MQSRCSYLVLPNYFPPLKSCFVLVAFKEPFFSQITGCDAFFLSYVIYIELKDLNQFSGFRTLNGTTKWVIHKSSCPSPGNNIVCDKIWRTKSDKNMCRTLSEFGALLDFDLWVFVSQSSHKWWHWKLLIVYFAINLFWISLIILMLLANNLLCFSNLELILLQLAFCSAWKLHWTCMLRFSVCEITMENSNQPCFFWTHLGWSSDTQ